MPQPSSPQVGPARFRAPELLFQPDLVGDESEGLHEVLAFAIHKSDMDLRRTLFSNIVLSGGSTLFKGTVGGGGWQGHRSRMSGTSEHSLEPAMCRFYHVFGGCQ